MRFLLLMIFTTLRTSVLAQSLRSHPESLTSSLSRRGYGPQEGWWTHAYGTTNPKGLGAKWKQQNTRFKKHYRQDQVQTAPLTARHAMDSSERSLSLLFVSDPVYFDTNTGSAVRQAVESDLQIRGR